MFQTKESLIKSTAQENECLQEVVILYEYTAALQNGPEDISRLAKYTSENHILKLLKIPKLFKHFMESGYYELLGL